MESFRDNELLALSMRNHIKSAVKSGRGIVRVTFEFGADVKEVLFFQRALAELVQPLNNSEANGDAAAESARTGYVSSDVETEWEGFAFGPREKSRSC